MSIHSTRLLQFFQHFEAYYHRQFSPLLERSGLSMREARVLLFLANNPDYDTARDITVLRGISKSQVSQAVELLAAEGLLARTPDPADRRVMHLAITEAGWPLARECQVTQEQCVARLLTGLAPEEVKALEGLLETVMDNGARLAGEAD